MPRVRQVYFSLALADLPVGIEQADGLSLVLFAAVDLSYIGRTPMKLTPFECACANPGARS